MVTKRSLDLIIPIYNEFKVLDHLFKRLESSFATSILDSCELTSVRIIFVDDGSSDDSSVYIAERIRAGCPALLVCLSRNFGHQAAVAAGLDQATADLAAIIDADLQDPPELIADMVHRLDEGFDVVYGQRRSRQEMFYKKAAYAAFYRLCSFLSEVHFPVDSGDFCLMRRDVYTAIGQLPEKLRFNRGLRSWVGFRQSALEYDRPGRTLGITKYSWSSLYALATDGIASLSTRPLRITQGLMFLSLVATLSYVGVSTILYFRTGRSDSQTLWFLSTQGLIALVSSLQFFSLYILGSYVGRTYLEVKARPTYVIARKVGLPPIGPA